MLIHLTTGLLQQSHLHRQILLSMSSCICLLPLLHHRRDPLHALTPYILHVRTQAHRNSSNATSRRRHGRKRRRHEPLPPGLYNHLLPDHSCSPHPLRRRHKLLFLQKIDSEISSLRPHSHVLRRCAHLILRPETRSRSWRTNQGCWRSQHPYRAGECGSQWHLHRLGRHLPAKI